MFHILFGICGCFDVPGFGLSRFYSILLQLLKSNKNSIFASSANSPSYYFYSDDETFVKQADFRC